MFQGLKKKLRSCLLCLPLYNQEQIFTIQEAFPTESKGSVIKKEGEEM